MRDSGSKHIAGNQHILALSGIVVPELIGGIFNDRSPYAPEGMGHVRIGYDCVCIDVDTTVSTVYGDIEGSRKGHNTKHRCKKGLRPVFLFIEETREYLCGTQRRSSTMTDEEMAKLIRQIGDNLPPCDKKVIVKGDDAEFIGGLTIQACIECGYEFIFGNKRCTPIFKSKVWRWGD